MLCTGGEAESSWGLKLVRLTLSHPKRKQHCNVQSHLVLMSIKLDGRLNLKQNIYWDVLIQNKYFTQLSKKDLRFEQIVCLENV